MGPRVFDVLGDGRWMNVVYPTWGDFLEDASLKPRSVNSGDSPQTDTSNASWRGTRTFEDAVKLARFGWLDGERKTRALAERMSGRILQGIAREDWRYEVEGTAFDVARYVEGEPEHWLSPDETFEAGAKVYRIVANCTASAGVETSAMIARGVGIAALAEALTFAGAKVEIDVVSTMGTESDPWQCAIKLKAADQPLEHARLAFALAHPSMLRRLVFAAHDRGSGPQAFGRGWGREEPLDPETLRPYTETPNVLYFGRMFYGDPQFASESTTETYIFETLATLGYHVAGVND